MGIFTFYFGGVEAGRSALPFNTGSCLKHVNRLDAIFNSVIVSTKLQKCRGTSIKLLFFYEAVCRKGFDIVL